jgi:hypothetical protein
MMDRARYGRARLRFTGIDRADSRKGYQPGNCIPCCRECNRIKSDLLTVEEMVLVVRLLKKLRRR